MDQQPPYRWERHQKHHPPAAPAANDRGMRACVQSANATASYIASAVEAGQAWSRVERFLLACLEGESAALTGQRSGGAGAAEHGLLRGLRVQVRGRLGERTGAREQPRAGSGLQPGSSMGACRV